MKYSKAWAPSSPALPSWWGRKRYATALCDKKCVPMSHGSYCENRKTFDSQSCGIFNFEFSIGLVLDGGSDW